LLALEQEFSNVGTRKANRSRRSGRRDVEAIVFLHYWNLRANVNAALPKECGFSPPELKNQVSR
jgi:hypothetical protein